MVSCQLKAAKLEIRDLQAEFEAERNDYLATIRRLERDTLLHNGLLERMAPLVRRDCNYSNLDGLRKEVCWDEDGGAWKLPDIVVHKTSLPSGETPGLTCAGNRTHLYLPEQVSFLTPGETPGFT